MLAGILDASRHIVPKRTHASPGLVSVVWEPHCAGHRCVPDTARRSSRDPGWHELKGVVSKRLGLGSLSLGGLDRARSACRLRDHRPRRRSLGMRTHPAKPILLIVVCARPSVASLNSPTEN